MNKNLKNQIKAFSLAEMMIVMLVVSILTAAMMPIFTRHFKGASTNGTDPIWQTSANDSNDIFFRNFGTAGAQVLIGETSESSVNSNLVINSPDTAAQILITSSGTPASEFAMNASGIKFGLSANTANGGLGFGVGANADGQNAIASAAGAATGLDSVALGYNSTANGTYSVAIGPDANASSASAVAIGSSSSAAANSTAIGEGAKATGSYSVALGTGAVANGTNSIALSQSTASGSNAVSIGYGTTASQDNSIVIGSGSNQPSANVANSIVLSATTINLDASYISLGGGAYGSSDMRLKNVKSPFTAGLETIDKIQPYNYTFKKDKRKVPYVGVMAQDLQKVFPNAVTKIDKSGHLGIRQEDMFYCMINSVKQLYSSFKSILVQLYGIEKGLKVCNKTEDVNPKLINELEHQNKALSIKNKQLKHRLALLEKKVK